MSTPRPAEGHRTTEPPDTPEGRLEAVEDALYRAALKGNLRAITEWLRRDKERRHRAETRHLLDPHHPRGEG